MAATLEHSTVLTDIEAQGIAERHGISQVDSHTYHVQGQHGVYEVRFEGRGDDDGERLWTCNCPAGEHGRTCRHINILGAALDELFPGMA